MGTQGANENKSREVMTTGEAAKRLGVSISVIRRRLDAGELRGIWTDPLSTRKDSNGNLLRGHRRVYVESVEEYERRSQIGPESPQRDS